MELHDRRSTPSEELQRLGEGPRRLADTEGPCFVTTFCEPVDGRRSAFYELVRARHVVVPSLDHISPPPVMRRHLIDRLEVDADARIWAVDEQS